MDRRKFVKALVGGLTIVGLSGLTALARVLCVCVWDMGTPCSGRVANRMMFSGQLSIPICSRHLLEHREVMGCYSHGFNTEKIIRWSPDVRSRIMKHFNVGLGKA